MSKNIGLAILATGLIAACAGGPPPHNAALEEARLAVARAEQNPSVVAYEPYELERAQSALSQAEYIWREEDGDFDEDDEELGEIEHLSYLALRRAEIAETRSRGHVAQKSWSDVKEERNLVLLQSRELQAEVIRNREREKAELARGQAALAELAALKEARTTSTAVILTFSDVLFDTAKHTLKPNAAPILDKLEVFLKENSRFVARLEGHADSRGSREYNYDLSRRRAQAVQNELYRRGIELNRVTAIGYGEERSVASNETPAGQALNRRVEVVIPTTVPQQAASGESMGWETEISTAAAPNANAYAPDAEAQDVTPEPVYLLPEAQQDPFGPTPAELFDTTPLDTPF